MDSTVAARPIGSQEPSETRKPYFAPAVRQVTPQEARGLLLEKADLSDPEVQEMLRRIDELQKASGQEEA